MRYISDDFIKSELSKSHPYSFAFINGEADEEQYRAILFSFLTEVVNNQTLLPYNWSQSGLRSIQELRAYATGKQDISKYQTRLCGNQNSKQKGKPKVSLMNISWDIPAFLPKMLRIAKNMAVSVPFSPDVEAIDPQSKLKKKYEIAFQKMLMDENMQLVNKLFDEAGAEGSIPKPQFETEYELAVHNNIIGLKTETEVSYQNLLMATDIWSDKDDVIKSLAKDLIEIGVAVKLPYIEEQTGKVKYKYIDPDAFCADYSEKPDCSDVMRAGHFEMMSLFEIQKESGINNADELIKIASKSNQHITNNYGIGNLNTALGRRERYYKRFGNMPLTDIRVPVFNFSFIAYDDINGHMIPYLHKAKWVCNTNFLFAYGKDDTPRDKNKEEQVTIPYKAWRLDVSMVDACIGLIDDICLATYKKRNALAKAIPSPGVMLNKKMLESVDIGGVTLQPIDNVEAMFQTGVGYFDPVDHFGSPVSGNYSNGVIPIPQKLTEDLAVFNSEIVTNLQQIEKILGINEYVDASNPNPRTSIGLAEMTRQATLVSLKDITDGCIHIYEATMEDCMRRWQIQCIKGIKEVFAPLGENNYKTITLTKDMAISEMGLFVKVLPDDAEINQLLATITQLRDMRQSQGSGGITPVQYLMIYKLLRQRKLDQAIMLLEKVQKQVQEEDMKRSMQMQQQNAQIQMQSSAAATENKVMEEAARTKREVEVQKEKHKGAMEKAMFEKILERANLQDELTVDMLMNQFIPQDEAMGQPQGEPQGLPMEEEQIQQPIQ